MLETDQAAKRLPVQQSIHPSNPKGAQMVRRKRFSLAIAASMVLGMVCLSRIQADDPQTAEDIPEIVKAADAAMKATMAEHQNGLATTEEVCQWSRRLMEAERTSGANENAELDHVTRMRGIHKKSLSELRENGVKGGSERNFHMTRYYLLEAQAEALKQAK